MDEDRYASDNELRFASEEDTPVITDDQHHERYYTDSAPSDERSYEKNNASNVNSRYKEETSAELSAPSRQSRTSNTDGSGAGTNGKSGAIAGTIGLILSILSLFVMPFILGVAGVIVGFIARRQGSGIGSWAIGIGVVSIVVSLFILPFF